MGLFAIAGVMSPQDRALGPDMRDLPLTRWLDALAGTSSQHPVSSLKRSL